MMKYVLIICACCFFPLSVFAQTTTASNGVPVAVPSKATPSKTFLALMGMRHAHPTLQQLQRASATPKAHLRYVVTHGPNKQRALYLLVTHFSGGQSVIKQVVQHRGAKSVLGRLALTLSGERFGYTAWLGGFMSHKSARVRRSVYRGLLISAPGRLQRHHDPDGRVDAWLKQQLKVRQSR